MAGRTRNLRGARVCLHCGEWSVRKPKKTFVGFQNLECLSCRKVSHYPLSQNYLRIYWLVLGCFLVYSIMHIMDGNIPVPGMLAIAAVFGLYQDRKLCKEVAAVEPETIDVPTEMESEED